MWTVRLKSKNEREQNVILPAKSRDVCVCVCGVGVCVRVRTVRGMFILTPHWCSHCCTQIEQWRWDALDLRDVSEASHPQDPWGPSPVLILACKENSRPSQSDSEVEPSKHSGRTETGGKEGMWGKEGGREGGHLWIRPQQL